MLAANVAHGRLAALVAEGEAGLSACRPHREGRYAGRLLCRIRPSYFCGDRKRSRLCLTLWLVGASFQHVPKVSRETKTAWFISPVTEGNGLLASIPLLTRARAARRMADIGQ